MPAVLFCAGFVTGLVVGLFVLGLCRAAAEGDPDR